jgi:hypothetical protein
MPKGPLGSKFAFAVRGAPRLWRAVDELALSKLEVEHGEKRIGIVAPFGDMVIDRRPDRGAVEYAAVEAPVAD